VVEIQSSQLEVRYDITRSDGCVQRMELMNDGTSEGNIGVKGERYACCPSVPGLRPSLVMHHSHQQD